MNRASFNNFYKKPVLRQTGFFLTVAILAFTSANAQHNKLPPFRMLLENNTVFRAQQLPFDKPIILIYFLPDCEHCQKLTTNIVNHINDFNRFSVVMITYYPPAEVGRFARRYGLDKHSNFYFGTEGNSFFLKQYYGLSRLPFAAIYTKAGDLVKTYNTDDFFTDLYKQLKTVP